MSIVDETILKAKEIADVTAKKASQISALTKLNVNLAETKGAIEKEYKELGELVYTAVKNDIQQGELVEEKVRILDELIFQKEELCLKIANIKGKKLCSECKKENDADSLYCCKCGNSLN
ncbi:MAG: hypothetical protein E7480_06250 [Ruminococcaceae bacterium]|nr:hypothetical protein [Oscillospiraceae bacterium]